MSEHAVVIAGGGPTGLMLAGELATAGVDVVVVEPRATQDVDGLRGRSTTRGPDSRRAPCRARRCLRHGLRPAQSRLDHPVHRRGATGGRLRSGRVLLAVYAAHVHPPQSGQGLDLGVQDAVNLGWKPAQVVLSPPDERHQALRDTMVELLALAEPRRHVAAMLAGLDVRYDLGEGHPLIGRRMPDLDLRTAEGPVRASVLLHEARPVLLDLRGRGSGQLFPGVRECAAGGRAVRRRVGPARRRGGARAVGGARPARRVRRWAGEPTDPALPAALSTWFGAGTSGSAAGSGR